MIHKTEVEAYDGTLSKLAEDLGDLRYDALALFLEEFSQKMSLDGEKDAGRGRHQLAHQLSDCAEQLAQAAKSIDKAWKICEPYM